MKCLKKNADSEGLSYADTDELLELDEVKSIYKKEMATFSRSLASHEKIRDFRLLPNEFTVENGEITPTMKVKRRVIAEKYAHLISDIFKDD